jgi:Zn-dependent protease
LHEAAHAWVAFKGGDPTAYLGGQASLDPWPHVRRHPFGMVILPLVSALMTGWPIGFASAPYDPDWARRHPRRAAVMALAGPAANLALVIVAALSLRIGQSAGVFYPPDHISFGALAASEAGATWTAIATFVSVLFSLNLLLCVFNLLPFAPLDGSAGITIFMKPEMTRKYQEFLWSTPMLGWLGLFLAWRVIDALFDPVFTAAASLIYRGATYG